MGVAGGELAAAVAGDDALVLAELEYDARQPGRNHFVDEVGQPVLAHAEPHVQEAYEPYADLGVPAHEVFEVLPPEAKDYRGFEGPCAQRRARQGREASLADDRPFVYHGDGDVLPGGVRFVYLHPPAHQQEEAPPVFLEG